MVTNKGFTLIEILVTAIIIGVISAIAAPNLIGLMNATRVKEGIAQIEGAIKEGQKQAIRLGKRCQVSVDTVNNEITAQTVEATPVNCLLSNRELNDSLEIATNDAVITFSSKGTPDNGTESIFVVHMPNGTNERRCLIVSPGLGIMRTGEYNVDPATLNVDNCVQLP